MSLIRWIASGEHGIMILCVANLLIVLAIFKTLLPGVDETWFSLLLAPGVYVTLLQFDWIQRRFLGDESYRDDPLSRDPYTVRVLIALFVVTVVGTLIATKLEEGL